MVCKYGICECPHIEEDHGACHDFLEGAVKGSCVYCAHSEPCHEKSKELGDKPNCMVFDDGLGE